MVLLKLANQPKGRRHTSVGFMLLETLLSLTIFTIFILFFLASWNNISATQDLSWKRVQASIYAQEGVEVSYNIITNSADWVNLTTNIKKDQIYSVNLENSPGFLPGAEQINEFTREIKIEPVYRSSKTHEIVNDQSPPSQGKNIFDPDTLLIRSTVKWIGKGGSQDVEYVTYITRGATQ